MPTREQSPATTILFTDIVESTQLLQREGDENAQRIFRAHRQMLGDTARKHGGREVKWLGDGLMAAFTSTAAALRCAIDIQQTARRPGVKRPLGVRIGVHVGEILREDDDFFGTAVVVARRMCDRAEPGQILCSSVVAGILLGRHAFVFADKGPYELKGISAAVHVYEVQYEAPSAQRITLLGGASKRAPGIRRTRLILVAAAGIIAAAIGAFAVVWALAGGDDGGGAPVQPEVVPEPTAQRIAATSNLGCLTPESMTCRGDWIISPEVHETGLRLAFTLTFQSETDCTLPWVSDLDASAQSFGRGVEDQYVVVDANNVTHRLAGVGGVASLTDDLPCNIPQLGWWQFDAVPPGPATFHYPDFAEPVSFVVPAAPTPVAPEGAGG